MPTETAADAPSQDSIRAAYALISPHIRRTPLLNLPHGAFGLDNPVSLKLEFLQHAGSFKSRGAFYSLLSQEVPEAGVTAASGGNHGAAVAYAARSLGHKARIFVPEISSPAKIAKIREFGAEVVVGGARYDDAQAACDTYAETSGALKIHPFGAWATMTGQATTALEWAGQLAETGLPPLDVALVAVGGGGLIGGMACWWRGHTRLAGIEPDGSCALHAALEAGHPVDVGVDSIAADSLGARNVGDKVFAAARIGVGEVVLVPDAAIRAAQKLLWSDYRIAAEPGGVTALAALVSGRYRPAPGAHVGVLICGANVDLATLATA
jgi:threonine dehydratase